MAQSNVTIYGVVDTFYGVSKVDNQKSVTRLENGGMAGSRIGFKGTEDLGNGLKANFVLEYNIATDSNSGIGSENSAAVAGGNAFTTTQARQQYVGLSGGFGSVMAGRLQTAGYYFTAAYTPFAGTGFDNAALFGTHDRLVAGSNGRANNTIAYVSPTFSGFSGEVDYSRLTEAAATTNQKDSTMLQVALKYANGPLSAQYIYVDAKLDSGYGYTDLGTLSYNSPTPATGYGLTKADKLKQHGIGASYDFGVAKIMGMYKTFERDAATSPADKTDDMWAISASVPLGKTTLLASYADAKIDSAANKDVKGWGLGARYALSKRTTVYANYTQITNDSASNVFVGGYSSNSAVNSAGSSILTAVNGNDSKAYGVGINHSF